MGMDFTNTSRVQRNSSWKCLRSFWWMSFLILRAALAFLKFPWGFVEGGPRELCEKCFNHPSIPSSHHPPPPFLASTTTVSGAVGTASSTKGHQFSHQVFQAASQPGIIPTNSCHLFFFLFSICNCFAHIVINIPPLHILNPKSTLPWWLKW